MQTYKQVLELDAQTTIEVTPVLGIDLKDATMKQAQKLENLQR